jgi:hypothetical protein
MIIAYKGSDNLTFLCLMTTLASITSVRKYTRYKQQVYKQQFRVFFFEGRHKVKMNN